jgi:hypothetical protein
MLNCPAPASAGAGSVTDHDRLAKEPVCAYRTPQRSLSGDAHRIGRHLQTGQTEPFKVTQPGSVIGKPALLMRGQPLDKHSGQSLPLRKRGAWSRM